mgnify:CR=1 FL=1
MIEPESPLPWRIDSKDDDHAIVDRDGLCVAMMATDCGDEMHLKDMVAIVEAVNYIHHHKTKNGSHPCSCGLQWDEKQHCIDPSHHHLGIPHSKVSKR